MLHERARRLVAVEHDRYVAVARDPPGELRGNAGEGEEVKVLARHQILGKAELRIGDEAGIEGAQVVHERLRRVHQQGQAAQLERQSPESRLSLPVRNPR